MRRISFFLLFLLLPAWVGAESYLIVTSEELQGAFSDLAHWKTQKGLDASVACIDTILQVYPGRDDAEKLRNFLIQAHQNGTRWVLLGGDEEVVPIRYAYHSNTNVVPSIRSQQVCDLYFSDVDGEWDVDNDGVWGEPGQDDPDIYPDLFVGRVPFHERSKIQTFVDNLIAYERSPVQVFEKVLWISSDHMSDGSQHDTLAQKIPGNYYQDLSRLIETPSGGAEYPTSPDGQTCVEVMKEGWGIIGVLAHGEPNCFVAKSSGSNCTPRSWVYADSVPWADPGDGFLSDLVTGERQGIMYSLGCRNGAFDDPLYTACVGQGYLEFGGVAFLGYSREGWTTLSYRLFGKFLECLFDEDLNPENRVGVAEAWSRCAFPYWLDLNYGHNLFGDPEMSVWTAGSCVQEWEGTQLTGSKESGFLKSFPNPFNSEVTISYGLKKIERICIEVRDLLGRRVCSLFEGTKGPGTHQVFWKGRNEEGSLVASGIYFCILKSQGGMASQKLLFVK
jgi:hypothetical protein